MWTEMCTLYRSGPVSMVRKKVIKIERRIKWCNKKKSNNDKHLNTYEPFLYWTIFSRSLSSCFLFMFLHHLIVFCSHIHANYARIFSSFSFKLIIMISRNISMESIKFDQQKGIIRKKISFVTVNSSWWGQVSSENCQFTMLS